MKTIYNLKLHEVMNIDSRTVVTRVPGGWLYQVNGKLMFVPYDEEFEEFKD